MTGHKVLIIKTGYSEVLDKEEDSKKVSLGDVLRTTPLLHVYKDDHVTWLTDEKAMPLLKGNPYIERILSFDWLTAEQLKGEEFDIVINLEKLPGICALVSKINAWTKYGFRLDKWGGKSKAYDRAIDVLAVAADPKLKKENKKIAQELLFEMIGRKWNGEEYILGYCPGKIGEFDIGLNTQIGNKWPTKAWPEKNWDMLEKMLKEKGFKISRQEKQDPIVLKDLNKYMDWLNSCKVIISNDSLGLHLALALQKKIIGLFGPTPYREVSFYNRGKALFPTFAPDCMPCFKGFCDRGKNCMEDISVEKVYEEVIRII